MPSDAMISTSQEAAMEHAQGSESLADCAFDTAAADGVHVRVSASMFSLSEVVLSLLLGFLDSNSLMACGAVNRTLRVAAQNGAFRVFARYFLSSFCFCWALAPHLLEWLQSSFPVGFVLVPSLSSILQQQSTAGQSGRALVTVCLY